jgi:2,5-dioxopentanoate dehydrogenase
MFTDATSEEINSIMADAWKAFHDYRKMPLQSRADFMHAIAGGLKANEKNLVESAMRETNLPEARLTGELARTIFQLQQYGDASASGEWIEARIDTADPGKKPPKPDIRKMLVPLGPVVIFGASNFPFAYSTAGGDTACAFAAGCPVIVKAHPAHAATSGLVAEIILKAVEECQMPPGIFAHVYGESTAVGKALVQHNYTKAVGFTGSLGGGKQLFDWGNQRKVPIPVFCEMGSINPVFLLREKLAASCEEIARNYAMSVTQGVGQFCTNPGLIIGIESPELQQFISVLGNYIQQVAPAKMLHPGIAKAFAEKKQLALQQEKVSLVATSEVAADELEGGAVIAAASGNEFLKNPVLHQEVFGPYSLVVACEDENQMLEIARNLEGQLTSTIMATDAELAQKVN